MVRPQVVVVGGGWAGCAAALAARKAGLDVILVERTNMLLGSGLVGGIFKNNGRLTALEELRCMGGGNIIKVMEDSARHTNLSFPGHVHASLYDVEVIEASVRDLILKEGIQLLLESRVVDAHTVGRRVVGVVLASGETIEGDAYVDATGTAGPPGSCLRYGAGCVMCIFRCPTFGPRVSLAAKARVEEKICEQALGMSGSCELNKHTVASWLSHRLDTNGCVLIPVPKYLVHGEMLGRKACQQYALPEYADNLVLLDTGQVKLMTPYFPLDELRRLPGMERVTYCDPYGGGRGNSVRFGLVTPRDDALRVAGLDNLFCAGEKAGLAVGHTEALVTGTLAGHNAARFALDLSPLVLPRDLAVGDFIAWVRGQIEMGEIGTRYTFSGGPYFARMKESGLYTTHLGQVEDRVAGVGLTNVFAKPLL
jgi:hypothetical protein